jgi:hypothetical protein
MTMKNAILIILLSLLLALPAGSVKNKIGDNI